VLAAALGVWLRFDAGAWLAGGAVLATFFFGRRLYGAWVGLTLAAALTLVLAVWAPDAPRVAVVFLVATGAWWALRFRDDRAPMNGLVALAALAAAGWLLLAR